MGIITEKNYPIRISWLLKSFLRHIPAIIFVAIFLGGGNARGNHNITFFIWGGVVLFNALFLFLNRANFHYSIDDKFMLVRQGIFSKKERHIPYGVIQAVFLKQGFLDRIFGLAALAVENAAQGAGVQTVRLQQAQAQRGIEVIGSSGNNVNIPGLAKNDAETLKGIILQKMKENPIEDNQSGL